MNSLNSFKLQFICFSNSLRICGAENIRKGRLFKKNKNKKQFLQRSNKVTTWTMTVFKSVLWAFFRVSTYALKHAAHTRGWWECRLLGLNVNLTVGRLSFERRNLIPLGSFLPSWKNLRFSSYQIYHRENVKSISPRFGRYHDRVYYVLIHKKIVHGFYKWQFQPLRST